MILQQVSRQLRLGQDNPDRYLDSQQIIPSLTKGVTQQKANYHKNIPLNKMPSQIASGLSDHLHSNVVPKHNGDSEASTGPKEHTKASSESSFDHTCLPAAYLNHRSPTSVGCCNLYQAIFLADRCRLRRPLPRVEACPI